MGLTALIVGGTRGLGASLVKQYTSQPSSSVFATTRSGSGPSGFSDSVKWLSNIELTKSNVGDEIVKQLQGQKALDVVVSALDTMHRSPLGHVH